jgi:hypothetical protein
MKNIILVISCFLSLNLWCDEVVKLKVKFEVLKCFSADHENVCSNESGLETIMTINLEKAPGSNFLTGTGNEIMLVANHIFRAEVLVNKDDQYQIASYIHTQKIATPDSTVVDYLGQVKVKELPHLNAITWSGSFRKVEDDFYLPSLTILSAE